MYSGKKITKEDTWKPADLKRHIREEGDSEDYIRRQDAAERKHRIGESKERRHREPEKESRRERDKHKEHESTRDRGAEDKKDKYIDQRKEGSRDRRGDKERDRRDETDREKRRDTERLAEENKYSDDYRENRDRRSREEKHNRDRNKERQIDKERVKDKEKYSEEGIDKRRKERDSERRREERDREHRLERRRHEESGEGGREWKEKYDTEQRDRHRERDRNKDEYEGKTNEKERSERHGERKHSRRKGEGEYSEDHRKHKEERERRHERGQHEEKQKHDREHRVPKESVEEVRHHHRDRERAERDKHKERRHKEEEDPERKHKERRQREEEDPERKHSERRQREEQDSDRKHRQRRHREEDDPERQLRERRRGEEEEEPERNHRDRTTLKKTSPSDKRHLHETNAVETEVVIDEDLGDQEYEDDFEDYEEDFEEMDDSENEGEEENETEFPQVEEREELTPQRKKEIEAIQRAMDEENERVGTAHSRQSTNREEEDKSKWSTASEKNLSRGSQHGNFIDFVAAKQREVNKKVASKQKKRSTELLRLIDLDFSMTVSLLDLPPVNEYDMYIRNFGSANTKQAYVQCNEDNADRDIQTEEIEMCEKWTQHPPEHSGACGDPNHSQEARDKTTSDLKFDSKRLTAFLSSASQVMIVLLEEDQAERISLRKLRTQTDTLSFSEGSLQLNTKLPFLYGRHVSLVQFSQVQRHTMMSVHAPTTKPSAVRLDSCTIICIWNIWEPSRPQKILLYESEVQCCCFSTGKAILVIAGTSVGSVVLWDLREPASNHYRMKIGEDEWTFRQPTFSTDSVMANSGHFSAVTSVEVVSSNVVGGLRPEVPLLASEEESSGLSFQLASLDESGVLNFWVVVELPKATEAGSPTDLGLRPGSKVKLLHSSSLHTADRGSSREAVNTGPLQSLQLKFLPSDSNHFFIGTNMGLVSHGTSHGLKAHPKFYRFQEPGTRPVDVTSIHFSPFRQNMFLVACGDGCIRLHGVSYEQPVAEWKSSTAGEPVVLLQWAQTRPTVFCVLDAASNLHIWDLLKNETEPVVTERLTSDRVTSMALFGNSGQQNIYSGVALAHESGKIEMQYFTRSFTVPVTAEEEKLESMMTEAF
uniref:WD repeat domain 60 n=1 Tax=Anabas testudineus TaxID=64144 RepID=A0AAQ6IRZ2_ANATE